MMVNAMANSRLYIQDVCKMLVGLAWSYHGFNDNSETTKQLRSMGQATRAKISLASRQGEENGISTWSKPCFSLKKVGGTAVGDWDMYIYIYTEYFLLV